ncbi:DinB family protein [Nakamurella sp. GG22]
MNDQPPLAPDELVATADERQTLATMLDWHRSVVVKKASNIDDAAAQQRWVPSLTTLAGTVRHLTGVEREWFQEVMAERPAADLPANSRGDDASWVVQSGETVAGLIAEYIAACEESREIAARLPLDHSVPHPRLRRVNLRWVYVHMIEETARHVGHMDILRELTDGSTGVDG